MTSSSSAPLTAPPPANLYGEMLADFTGQLPLPIAGQHPDDDPVRAAATEAAAAWQAATEAALALALAIANQRARG